MLPTIFSGAAVTLALALHASASPLVANATVEAEKRTVGGAFLCTDINWSGTCGHFTPALGACVNLDSFWNKQVSSFGPDECTRCDAYGPTDCTFFIPGGSPSTIPVWHFTYPGDDSGGLSTNNPWNDRIQSFVCFSTC
ncbi:hypothetical protein PsYK624_128540 [Phanerochaete sordida]|uniref:Uncharacterized protein n=1 Tax=Phanerochaete sordida TaxID=48140 RepID=A0A9P3GKM2_9APHY|nr:hypothetical protein PsYK624_128540 [Phanerochaete sordida]